MTTAAIYCRKSTEDKNADENKSVPRQEQLSRAFAAERGWTVREVFIDDGVSGAEFGGKRPGLGRLLASAKRGAFRYLIVSEQKSLGREQFGTQALIKELAQLGVEVFAYMDRRSLTPKNAMDKAMFSLRAFGDEAHREDTSRRGHEAHTVKQARGQVVGGRTFGYRNVDVAAGTDAHGRTIKSHTTREVDAVEAAVVRRMFALYAEGHGLKAIAKILSEEGAPGPKPFTRKHAYGVEPVGGWVPSTVRHALRNEAYRGVYVWNKSKKRDEWGAVKQRPRPQSEWKRTPMPEWRIVSDELWNRVAERREESEKMAARFSNGQLMGRAKHSAVTNLLANLATCGVCGGGLVVETYKTTTGKPRKSHYVCARRRANGKCSNRLRMPVDLMNEAVLQAIEEHALTPEAVEHVILSAEGENKADQRKVLEREARDIEKRLRNVMAAIELGGNAAMLVAKLTELESRKAAVAESLADLRPMPRLAPEVVEGRLAEWRRLLRGSVGQGRTVLDRVLVGRMVFTPTASGDGYTFEAPTRYDRLFFGVAVPKPSWIPDGTEGVAFGPEDTMDGDYGRLLERAYRNANRMTVASPPGFEPGFQP